MLDALKNALSRAEWVPVSLRQDIKVHDLVRAHEGAMVRTRDDGVAEVIVWKQPNHLRYEVDAGGTATLRETIPAGRRWELLLPIMRAGFAAIPLSILLAWLFDTVAIANLAIVGFGVGLLALMGRLAKENQGGAQKLTRHSENWFAIGYPDDGDASTGD